MFEQRLPYGIWDADNHFPEPQDAIPRYIDPKFRDKVAVDVIRRERDRLKAESEANPDDARLANMARMLEDKSIAPGMTLNRLNPYKTLSPEEREELLHEFRAVGDAISTPESRLAVMDAQGLEGVLMFPQREGLIVHDCFPDDVEATFANVRAFNRYVETEWGYAYADRIFIPAAMSFADVDLAIQELEHVIEHGAKTVLLPPGPINHHSPADPKFDPFWARAEEAGVNISVHLNYTEYQHQSVDWGEDPNAHYTKQPGFTAFQWFAYWGDRPVMELTAALIFHNLFTRFPGLKVCLAEQGSVWLPYALRKMDHGFMLGRPATFGPQLDARPSEIFRNHFLVAPFPEEIIKRPLEVLTIDQLVFGSDFPHGEGLDDPSKYVTQAQFDDLTEEDQRKLMRDNLRDFLVGSSA
jgi:predicted TIM-barrel fold metal-dependent hydrolase